MCSHMEEVATAAVVTVVEQAVMRVVARAEAMAAEVRVVVVMAAVKEEAVMVVARAAATGEAREVAAREVVRAVAQAVAQAVRVEVWGGVAREEEKEAAWARVAAVWEDA